MATYVNIYAMKAAATFNQQVAVACWIAAQNIVNELGTVPNHANRLVWAKSVLKATAGNVSVLDTMASACAMNATLQATAPSGPWNDADIQFTVNSLIDIQST